MIRFRKLLPLAVAALVGAAFLAAPTPARADLEIALQEDAGPFTVVATGTSFTSTSFTGTFGDFTVTILGGSSGNGALLSDLLSSTTLVTNNDGAGHILHLFVTQDGYTLPIGPKLKVESGLGGSLQGTTTATLTDIFQAYAATNNALFGTGDFTNGPQNASQNVTTFDTGSATGVFTRGAGDFSLTTVANLELSPGGTLNYSDHENVTNAVPEPSGVVLALNGLAFLGMGVWLQRRKAKVQNS